MVPNPRPTIPSKAKMLSVAGVTLAQASKSAPCFFLAKTRNGRCSIPSSPDPKRDRRRQGRQRRDRAPRAQILFPEACQGARPREGESQGQGRAGRRASPRKGTQSRRKRYPKKKVPQRAMTQVLTVHIPFPSTPPAASKRSSRGTNAPH